MALTVAEILTEVRVEIGDVTPTDGTDPKYSDTALTDTYIPAAVTKMNSVWPQTYEISSGAFNPDPTLDANDDRRALVVASALTVIASEAGKAFRTGAYHSDVAGATDLRDRAQKMKEWRDALAEEFDSLWRDRVQRQAEGDISLTEISRSAIAFGS